MNTRHLEFLRLVVNRGSFAKAAESAGVSQPAVKLAMRAPEQELCFALFEKRKRLKQRRAAPPRAPCPQPPPAVVTGTKVVCPAIDRFRRKPYLLGPFSHNMSSL